MSDHNPPKLSLDDAKTMLAGCYRVQYGIDSDCEVDWYADEPVDGHNQTPIASGQFGSSETDGVDVFVGSVRTEFTGGAAMELVNLGKRRSSAAG